MNCFLISSKVFVLITEIFCPTFWCNRWRYIFDVVKETSLSMSYLFSQFLWKGCATSKFEAKICDLLIKHCEKKLFKNGHSKLKTIRKIKTKGQFWVTKLVYCFNWTAGFTKMRSILQRQNSQANGSVMDYFALFP